MLRSLTVAVALLAAALAFLCPGSRALAPALAAEASLFSKDLAEPKDILAASAVSADDGGLKLQTAKATTLQLATLDDPDVESAIVSFSAKLRTRGLKGQAYLEMLCRFKDKGEFFSRGMNMPLSGDTDWTTQAIPFYLNAGENPDRIQLNLIVTGPGEVWIDMLEVRAVPWKP
ncbi:hypothetical protein [Megalodesulfovibrio paquesii]